MVGLPLPQSYYLNEDVLALAQDLLGKVLISSIEGVLTGGIITETEAYRGPEDRASHAFQNRKTRRNAIMFAAGGYAYVYRCYGIHNLFNVVTNREGIPHAVLIRALYPTIGLEAMFLRRKGILKREKLCNGPGTLTQALGINNSHNGLLLTEEPLWIEEGAEIFSKEKMIASPRIGIDYAGEDALLPWRFQLPSPL